MVRKRSRPPQGAGRGPHRKGECSMRTMRPPILAVAGAVAILALIAVSPAFAADPAQGPIHRGVDLWMTVAGFARTSFAEEPIPAGFFCEGSRAFTGA